MRLGPLACCVLAAAAVGCGGGEKGADRPMKIDWDLSKSHTTEDVSWPRPEQSAVELGPIGSVRITLPGGRTVGEEDGVVRDIALDRRGDQLRGIQLDSPPLSDEGARELAVRWAKEWGLSAAPFSGGEATAISGGRDERIGDDGPIPSVEIRKSFRDEQPALASLSFFWPD